MIIIPVSQASGLSVVRWGQGSLGGGRSMIVSCDLNDVIICLIVSVVLYVMNLCHAIGHLHPWLHPPVKRRGLLPRRQKN